MPSKNEPRGYNYAPRWVEGQGGCQVVAGMAGGWFVIDSGLLADDDGSARAYGGN